MANEKISAMTAASALDGAELLAGVQSGASVKITADQVKTFVDAPSAFSINDGSTTVAAVATLSITGGTVGGTTPDATLTVSGGAPAIGSAGVVQASDGAGAFQESNFADLSAGQTTVKLVTSAGVETQAAMQVSGAGGNAGALVVGPSGTGVGTGFIEVDGFGAAPAYYSFRANGNASAETKILDGDALLDWTATGFTGTSYANAFRLLVNARSDFDGTPTSSFDLQNATGFGLHVAADGTFSTDGPLTTPGHTPSSATDAGSTGTITWDANFIYVCVNTNTWVRAALATWP